MTSDDDLRQAFQAHAARALDPVEVHAQVTTGISRRRRRHQAAAVAGVTLTVTGLTVGVLSLGTERHVAGHTQQGGQSTVSAPPPPSPSAPTPSPITSNAVDDAVQAFFNLGGGNYDAALALATAWDAADPYVAKALIGQRLLDGKPVPITRGSSTLPPLTDEDRGLFQHALAAFTANHYTPGDAKELAALWQGNPVELVEAVAGQQLLDGHQLPVPPSG